LVFKSLRQVHDFDGLSRPDPLGQGPFTRTTGREL